MKTYSKTLRQQMLKKMLGPDARPVPELSAESGIATSTLYTWRSRADKVGGMKALNAERRPDDWSLDEKIAALAEASALPEAGLGEFLRRRGLHEADLESWRQRVAEALGKPVSKRTRSKSVEAKQIQKLERELRRKDKALAETAALLILKKKAQAIWGDGDDGTKSGSEK